MVTVVNNTITLVRGDTVEIPVTIRLRNGEKYIPSEGDVIRFALKESYGDNVPVLIRKVLPNSAPILRLESCETRSLRPERSRMYMMWNSPRQMVMWIQLSVELSIY